MAPPILIPVYEYSANPDVNGNTVETFLYSNLSTVESGWTLKGVAFRAFEKNHRDTVAWLRYEAVDPYRYQYSVSDPYIDPKNPSLGFDRDWKNTGTAFYAFKTQQPDTIPVFQYSATSPQRYRYSTNSKLEDAVWHNDGATFYVSDKP